MQFARCGTLRMAVGISASVLLVCGACGRRAVPVVATVETEPVASSEDAADDPAIWWRADEPAASRIIGTDKRNGLVVYDLEGRAVQRLDHGRMNNVDLREVPADAGLGGARRTLVTASNRTDGSVTVYELDPAAGLLVEEPVGRIPTGLDEPYGLCMGRDPSSGAVWVFVGDKSGTLQQWELRAGAGRAVEGTLVRTLDVGSQAEGMVCDDATGRLFVAEEVGGLWVYGARPGDGGDRRRIDRTRVEGPLVADTEGLAIYRAGNGRMGDGAGGGWLVASSQGDSTFAVYGLDEPHAYVGSFRVAAGEGIDRVSGTDGLEVSSAGFGAMFPEGLVVVQDDDNAPGNQNFKLVDWRFVMRALQRDGE